MNSISDMAIHEVYESHVLIQTWLHGTDDATPEIIEKLFSKFSNDFLMINTSGKEINIEKLRDFLIGMRGKRPDVKIKITEPQILFASDDCCILKYEELQYMSQETLQRISTAVFIKDNMGRLLQQYLHETWIA